MHDRGAVAGGMSIAGANILVLEDEPIIGLALEDQLTSRGATVHLAERLEEAEAILTHQRIDYAILDVNVHGTLSYALAAELGGKGITYVFATGYGDRSHPPGFAGVPTISKPYSIEDIERALLPNDG